MFCPQCGQERSSQATSFCSRCGYLLTGTAELLQTGGALMPAERQLVPVSSSPRSRGLKQGLFMFLSMFLVAPLLGIIAVFALGNRPWPVGIAVLILGLGGLLRIAYALMFESNASKDAWRPGQVVGPTTDDPQLTSPPLSTLHSPLSTFPAGNWRDTKDLEPSSVTEHTTRQLEKEQDFSE